MMDETETSFDTEPIHRRAVSSGEVSLAGSDEERAVSDSEIPRVVEAKELARQVKGPSSDALEVECEKARIQAIKDEAGCCSHNADDEDSECAPEVDEDGYEDILGCGDLWKKTVRKGSGERGCAGQWVKIKVKCDMNPNENYDELRFPLGYHFVIDALELVTQLMQPGEICLVRSAGRFVYGNAGRGVNIPPNAPHEFEVELLEVGDVIAFDQMSLDEVNSFLLQLIERASFYFRMHMIEHSLQLNKKCIEIIDKELETKELNDTKLKAVINAAHCYHRLEEPKEGLEMVSQGLAIDSDNPKLLFKQSQLFSFRKDFKEAVGVLKKLTAAHPDIQLYQTELSKATVHFKEQLEKEKIVYRRIFGYNSKPAKKSRPPPPQPSVVSRYTIAASLVCAISIGLFLIMSYVYPNLPQSSATASSTRHR